MTVLRREIALLAYHFHWSYAELMHMEHHQRRAWMSELHSVLGAKAAAHG